MEQRGRAAVKRGAIGGPQVSPRLDNVHRFMAGVYLATGMINFWAGAIYDIDFEWLDGVERNPHGHGFSVVDHMTHDVYRGRMAYWAQFYERLFGFREIRYFDIEGEYTGLTSKAMTAPDRKIRIPLNEESGRGSGQIEEFLMQFNGEGIQHIGLLTDDLSASVDSLQMAGGPVMSAPNDIYYEMLEERLPGHGENVDELRARGILLDEGFGEGNFKALFESMERDRIRRGVLEADKHA